MDMHESTDEPVKHCAERVDVDTRGVVRGAIALNLPQRMLDQSQRMLDQSQRMLDKLSALPTTVTKG